MSSTAVRAMVRSPFVLIVGAVLTWFIAAFLVWPNINVLIATFFPDGSFSGRAAEKLFSSQRAMKALGNSFLLAVALSITVNLVGVFIVLVTHYFRIRGSRILFLGYASTFIYGGIVLAAGYKFIYGDKGIVTSLLVKVFPGMDPAWFSGFFAVLVVMTFATTTNHMLFVANALKGVDYQTIEAARNLGASTWTILRRIVLPMLKPTLFAVTILSFLTGLGALSAPQVLGGRDFQTITPMILTFTNSPTSRDLAALLAVILGLATILMLAVMSRLEKGGTYFSVSKVSSALQKQDITNPVANVVVHAVAYLLFAVYTLPVVLIVLYSFADGAAIQTGELAFGSLTLENYQRVLTQQSGLRPFIVSVVYSALAALIAVGGLLFVARLLQKYKNWVASVFEYLLHIPWILPSALLALGLIISYDHPNPLVGGAVLTGTTVILLIAFVTVKIPFTLRMLKASFASVNSSLEEAAAIMGAKTLYVFRRILLPLVLPAAAAITALNFNSLLDDYDTAIFLAHPLVQPLGLVIKANTDGAEGVDGVANTFVYTVLLMVITGVTMYLVYGRSSRERSRKKKLPAVPPASQAPGPGLPGTPVAGEDAPRPAAPVR
ncbi:ABC transporter permease [Pseudarthrobacter scleromae]|uniref:Iron ABC transporter permease n=1 Tax=Pseudarthrobacter scleromae TaxID=158897 RepID=A0ABQ2CCD0_9MICC|nr:iron ABC transporter permease [Pseudarthrobacter scleromae]GGI75182.1 iron ABC transporter permease [Pseudarthrobacter scleromae]